MQKEVLYEVCTTEQVGFHFWIRFAFGRFPLATEGHGRFFESPSWYAGQGEYFHGSSRDESLRLVGVYMVVTNELRTAPPPRAKNVLAARGSRLIDWVEDVLSSNFNGKIVFWDGWMRYKQVRVSALWKDWIRKGWWCHFSRLFLVGNKAVRVCHSRWRRRERCMEWRSRECWAGDGLLHSQDNRRGHGEEGLVDSVTTL